jgi:hypothetical protein
LGACPGPGQAQPRCRHLRLKVRLKKKNTAQTNEETSRQAMVSVVLPSLSDSGSGGLPHARFNLFLHYYYYYCYYYFIYYYLFIFYFFNFFGGGLGVSQSRALFSCLRCRRCRRPSAPGTGSAQSNRGRCSRRNPHRT